MDQIDKVLKNKVIEASGCTEPIAVAYACANAAKLIKSRPTSVELELSANVIKNAMIVCLPGTHGKYGIKLAAAMGALYGNADKGLKVIAGFTTEQIEESEKFSKNVCIKAVSGVPPLYIKAKIKTEDGNESVVEVSHYHTFITRKELNGTVLDSATVTEQKKVEVNFGIKDIFDYVDGGKGDMEFVDKIIDVNGCMSDEGLTKDYGLRLGKAIIEHDKAYELLGKLDYILERTTAAVDARMAGADLPVMSNSGSGNQGLIATVPVMAAAEALNVGKELERKCVLLSSLIAIYIKSKHDVLSAYCGAAIAGTGVAAALTYMMGGNESHVRMAIQNSLGNTFGVLCDGAKETCSLKVANCTFSAVYSAFLALKGNSPKMKEGIICPEAEGTIENIASLGKKTSGFLDKALMEIMLG